MWLAIKESILREAARKKPPGDIPETEDELRPVDKLHINELGTQGAIHYRRLLGRFPSGRYPEAQIGPDETIEHHYSRLKSLLNDELAPGQAERNRAREKGNLAPQTTYEETQKIAPTQPWVGDLPTPSPTRTLPNDLAQRVPGRFTGDTELGSAPIYERPPLARRTPGNTMAPAYGPSYAPPQQSMQEWVNWLRGKGITVNHQLMRPDAAQIDSGPMPQGQDIWSDFVGKTTPESYYQTLKDAPAGPNTFGTSLTKRVKDLFKGRRVRSSTIVNEYISGVLTGDVLPKLAEYDPAAFWDRFNRMKKAGWDFTESGSGNHWHKEIDGKHHFLVGEPDGWTHYISNSPTSYAGSTGYGPIPNLDEAVLDAKIGPLKQMALPKQQRDREEMYKSLWGDTRPIGRMVPPEETNGMMQRLNHTSRWEEQ